MVRVGLWKLEFTEFGFVNSPSRTILFPPRHRPLGSRHVSVVIITLALTPFPFFKTILFLSDFLLYQFTITIFFIKKI